MADALSQTANAIQLRNVDTIDIRNEQKKDAAPSYVFLKFSSLLIQEYFKYPQFYELESICFHISARTGAKTVVDTRIMRSCLSESILTNQGCPFEWNFPRYLYMLPACYRQEENNSLSSTVQRYNYWEDISLIEERNVLHAAIKNPYKAISKERTIQTLRGPKLLPLFEWNERLWTINTIGTIVSRQWGSTLTLKCITASKSFRAWLGFFYY